MQLAMIGLGRMGANMVRRLMGGGHECVVYDVSPAAVEELVSEGARGAGSLAELVGALERPRRLWLMIPAALVDGVLEQLAPLLEAGDVLIDGGNSHFKDDVDRAERLAERGLVYLDVGTSGGVRGLERGYCLMIGGDREAVLELDPVFRTLCPSVEAAPRTPGATGEPSTEEHGYLHCGPAGAGHFVKMVHNGIEYGIMAAYAEGLNLLSKAGVGREDRGHDAETAPLRDPRYYRFELPLERVAEVWRRGSVISSWLLDLTAEALRESPTLEDFDGRVSDSGEGRWTAEAAVETGTPAHVLTAALFDRFESRGRGELAGRVLSAMRLGFGGHRERGQS